MIDITNNKKLFLSIISDTIDNALIVITSIFSIITWFGCF